MTVRDRFDCIDVTRAGLVKRFARKMALSSEAGRAAAYVAVSPLVVLATKQSPARGTARTRPEHSEAEAGSGVEVT